MLINCHTPVLSGSVVFQQTLLPAAILLCVIQLRDHAGQALSDDCWIKIKQHFVAAVLKCIFFGVLVLK
jgi:hypothetical protein